MTVAARPRVWCLCCGLLRRPAGRQLCWACHRKVRHRYPLRMPRRRLPCGRDAACAACGRWRRIKCRDKCSGCYKVWLRGW